METDITRTFRAMAWERAKGELNSMKHTYYGPTLPVDEPSRYDRFVIAFDNFVSQIEDEGLQE